MNGQHWILARQCIRRGVAPKITTAVWIFWIANLSAAGTLDFDLTASVGSFDVSERVVDLGQRFSRIDSAYVRFEGNYTPGLLLAANWIPPRTYHADNFHFIIRLGEPGTTWLDKRVYARPSLQGLEGEVAFEMLLQENAGPAFWPSGDATPNFEFLLDGQFGLSVTGILFSLPGEVMIEPPRFALSRFSLHLNGVAIPEPSCIATCIAAALCLGNFPRRVGARAT